MNHKMELLAPAGDYEKFKMALAYGADAIYLSGKRFGLRAFAGNFSEEELQSASIEAKNKNTKLYVTLNIIPHSADFIELREYLLFLNSIKVDALIVSDPGVIALAKEVAPDMELHLSTQANCVNEYSAAYWHRQGIKRVVLARELSLEQIKHIRSNTPKELELEVFVHGAMCIAYSGRCLLSNYLADRSGNHGQCAQPCRWQYSLVEKKRPDQSFDIEEDDQGAYILNSKDLCMISHLKALEDCSVTSLKIEGRMKSAYYTACVTGVYRHELDRLSDMKQSYQPLEQSVLELEKVSHRPYTTAFYFGSPNGSDQEYTQSQYVRNYDFAARALGYDEQRKCIIVEQRNHFKCGDTLEMISPNQVGFSEIPVTKMLDQEYNTIETAPHPLQTVYIESEIRPHTASLFRKRL